MGYPRPSRPSLRRTKGDRKRAELSIVIGHAGTVAGPMHSTHVHNACTGSPWSLLKPASISRIKANLRRGKINKGKQVCPWSGCIHSVPTASKSTVSSSA
ncbi:hypothetical protein CABS01_16780 [Colletotrichum abscissum]|uniref:uncharacterized protein n=1 Tax=Colletotrichum abscissum TaxID=1671311 RepID=UPI0027D6D895|nr:uncharacterized protein CABS01_16780 [Colletotrichum abscissum]KAK1512604.1 hypothetical protein CABS01_16780 [Colletotrichum abscissum]